MDEDVIIKKANKTNGYTAAAITVFLLIRDLLLIFGLINHRGIISFLFLILVIISSLVGIIIGLNALWLHWRENKQEFFKFISTELLLSVSPILYILFALVCY